MGWIIVRNWEKFQHYRDRNVPWIKFYTELTSDDAWRNLTHHQRGVLSGIWLSYATTRSQLRDSTLTLTRQLGQRVLTRDLQALKKAGFIDICSRPNLDHIQMNARPTRARGEAETETEKEKLVQTSERDVNDLPFELTLARTRLLATIGSASDNGTAASLDRYGLPPAAWYAAAEELERRGGKVNNRARYVVGLFKAWTEEGRYA